MNCNRPICFTKIDLIVGALKGAARRHIGEVRGQDAAELDRIWKALEDTYFNPYLLMRSHLGKIIDLPPVPRQKPSAYREMIDTRRKICMR